MSQQIIDGDEVDKRGAIWTGDSLVQHNTRYVTAAVIAAFILFGVSINSLVHGTRPTVHAMPSKQSDEAKESIRVSIKSPTKKPTDELQKNVSAPAQEEANVKSTSQPAQAEVQINGQHIPVPANGKIEQVVPSTGSSPDVSVSIDSTSTGTSESSSSTELEVNSSTRSEVIRENTE